MTTKAHTRGTHTTGMTSERLNKLRECWEDGDLDLDDEEEMLDALSFYVQLHKEGYQRFTNHEQK